MQESHPGPRRWRQDVSISAGLLLLLLTVAGPAQGAMSSLEGLWREAVGTFYQAPTRSELQEAEGLFRETLAAGNDPHLVQDWAALGFEMLAAPGLPDCLALRETPGRERGWGFFLLCPERDSGLFLQVPHGLSDLDTGRIGLRLFRDGGFYLGAWNTVQRNRPVTGGGGVADWAHRRGSLLIALTRAAVADGRLSRAIQIHGFSQAKRRSRAGASALAIVSSGRRPASPYVGRFARCLEAAVQGPVRVYPSQVAELGGTRNAIGAGLADLGHGGFVHLEMSRDLRRRLVSTAALRRALNRCLAEAKP